MCVLDLPFPHDFEFLFENKKEAFALGRLDIGPGK